MQSFEKVNSAYNAVLRPDKMSLGVFFAIESYDGAIPRMENQVELAQRAEVLGFSALWFRDVPMYDPSFGDTGQIFDPWVYLGISQGRPKKLRSSRVVLFYPCDTLFISLKLRQVLTH